MELRHLRAFCAVAQEMQVTKAAKRLKVAQPALTQQIRLLEKSLGQQLLRPRGRGIELTEAGVFFHREAEALLLNLHDACLKANEIGRGGLGVLRIGVTEGASFNPTLAAALSAFREQWPAVQLCFSQRQTPDLAEDLRTNRIDAAFLCPLPLAEGLVSHKLYAEDMLIAVPMEHRLAGQSTLPVSDLRDEQVFLISHGNTEHSLESSLIAACEREGFAPRIAQTVPEFMLALNLVAAGLGLTFVPPYMQTIHADTIAYRPLKPAANIVMETVLTVREGETAAVTRNLCKAALQAFAGCGVSG